LTAFKKSLAVFVFLLLLSSLSLALDEILIRLEGSYLAYSYDLNQIYGENVEFQFSSYTVSCQSIKIDLTKKIFYSFGNVALKTVDETLFGDEFLFYPQDKIGSLISYKEKIEVKDIGNVGQKIFLELSQVPEDIDLSKIQKSFIYFTGQIFQITTDFDVYGYSVTLYIEGLEFVSFKKFKLSGQINQRRNGVTLDKIWYTKSQGLIGRLSYFYQKQKKVNTLTQLNYEEHSVLKNYQGLKRQADVMSSTTINFNENLNLGLAANYNSSSLWNTDLWLNKNWGQKISTRADFLYNKPLNFEGEAWFGLQSSINTEKFGNISFSGKYEIQNQILSNFSYGNTLLKRIHFSLSSFYSQVKIGAGGYYSKILTGAVDVSYNSRLFNLSTYYFLNYDLFSSQVLSQPQLRFGLNPFQFYGGLLSANVSNMLIYNKLTTSDIRQNSFSDNLFINISTQPISIQKSLSLDFNLGLEQFIEKEGRNFTSGGLIIHADKNIAEGISLLGFYSFQSRRKTKSWLIEGTTSQDLSAIFKVNPSEKLNSWISFSFDPKNSQWRQSFADLSFELIKNWKLHSLLNYDFIFKKINNIDLYLIREAGRFQLRFIWRSLSKQILLELVPR
jgi:hypothetical protein